MEVAEKFSYFGVLMHWKESAEAAWEDRQGTAYKALGALLGTLFMVPFLPFARMREIFTAIVGGVYLYGSEVWAPFVPHSGCSPGSRVSKEVLWWLTGMGGARTERCRGWIMVNELDVEAESRALRILRDAEQKGGLLERAVKQMHANYRKAGRQAGGTWLGRIQKRVRRVWPSFRLEVDPSLRLLGIPEDGKISRKYLIATWQQNWQDRQAKLYRIPPKNNQQDFILYKILLQLCPLKANGSRQWLTEAVFPSLKKISHEHLQTLVRFLGGKADFARINKHESRWKAFPGLRDSDVKEACLFCWKTRRLKFWDSEWHAIFDCPTCRTPRQRFQLALRASPNKVEFKPLKQRNRLTISSDLASLVLKCRSDEQLVCDLARFVVDSLSCRQQAFRKLDVRDIFPTV